MPPVSSARESIFFRPVGALPGVDHLSVKNSSKLWRIYHEAYAVCSVVQGQSEWMYRGKHHETFHNCLMLMEPGEIHSTKRINSPGTFDSILIPASYMREISLSMGMPSTPHFNVANLASPKVFSAFYRLFRRLTRGAGSLEIESRFVHSIARLLEACAEVRGKEATAFSRKEFLQARDFLQENYHRPVSLQDLASMAGLTRFHFLRSFCQAFGLPPHAYQIQVRVAKAKEALRRGMKPQELELGFADQSHLIRQFKQVFGVTPGQYAELVQKPFSGRSI